MKLSTSLKWLTLMRWMGKGISQKHPHVTSIALDQCGLMISVNCQPTKQLLPTPIMLIKEWRCPMTRILGWMDIWYVSLCMNQPVGYWKRFFYEQAYEVVSASARIICVLTKNSSVSGDRKSREIVLISHTKTSNLVLLHDSRELMGNISSVMTEHIVLQRRLHRFAYLIIFSAIDYNLLMLFYRFILVPCHQH